VAEVAERLPEELILNLQGDEPLLPASTVDTLVRFGRGCAELTAATAAIPLLRETDVVNPNIVKVVCSLSGNALYFSRYPLPYCKSEPLPLGPAARPDVARPGYFKHIGIYLYRKDFLLKYVRLSSGPLEISESLEQLRILEHGFPIFVVHVQEDSLSVDTEEDLAEVESILQLQRPG
jgi:3-deoxy-manno-octulosonate cytidylyltransferase (CMP-KDO synthetase)